VEHQTYVAAIRREGDALARAARAAGLDAPVPACPEWTIADLLAHVGRIHYWVADIVATRPQPPSENWRHRDPPPLEERFAWFEAGYPALADALGALSPDEDVWTWIPDDHSIGFWARRQAHELAVHRWDAQGAAGTREAIERELAVDGIQEVFDILPARPGRDPIRGDGETIHLHCTDGEGEWLIRFAPGGLEVTREHAKGDVAARGTASDLMLAVWGRIGADQLEVFGDASLLQRWQDLTRF
jgi:uncharacterized protein (TIGR03083 family)